MSTLSSVAVVGGAGYIGAHMTKLLSESGYSVTVIDDLSTGHRNALQWGTFSQCSIHDEAALDKVFAQGEFTAVFHFAGAIVVPESIRDPLKYYQSNLSGTVTLLQSMQRHGIRRLIFSSTAALFGKPQQPLIDESHPIAPISPYGHSKAMVEQVLRDCAMSGQLSAVALRYFNAAGADPSGSIGEAHEPETHLIPLLLRAALGDRKPNIYGTDHPTVDGTCVRDYIHVNDLCAAHLQALRLIERSPGFHAYNLGYGRGYTVLEVVRSVERVTGISLSPQFLGPRPGDPAQLVANPQRALKELEWKPQFDHLDALVETAWRWEQSRWR